MHRILALKYSYSNLTTSTRKTLTELCLSGKMKKISNSSNIIFSVLIQQRFWNRAQEFQYFSQLQRYTKTYQLTIFQANNSNFYVYIDVIDYVIGIVNISIQPSFGTENIKFNMFHNFNVSVKLYNYISVDHVSDQQLYFLRVHRCCRLCYS